ncbi:MAG TPA: tRNA (adenosine(37)-N6)-threonylcarbamoyltransferase complex transferase subunit TsaD [Candidatus Saccharibacteria bacterium]|nr:tRNA (adenosine(37)-N6)-threonylcarbamoyltransferase complex transferase subunit TsaD [Candidatus Saccharibacteria bacterium]
MKILGIESSCDETAASVVEDGYRILSNVVNSQIDIHKQYGGVVPEVAARSHIEVINPVINKALQDASLSWENIDGIAVTYAPGLVGSLLVGTLAARTISLIRNIKLYPVHHIEAHVYANFLVEIGDGIREMGNEKWEMPSRQPKFPILALIVSGGHTQLVYFRNHGDYEILGQTCDDAVGEAFDKVAKIIGLPYPGGPSISEAAKSGDPLAYKFPKAHMQNAYDFSFSGLKTAVLRAIQQEVGVDITFPSTGLAERLNDLQRNNFASSFQRVAVETLVDKTVDAFYRFNPKSVIIAGGVAANQELRRILKQRIPIDIEYAPINLCTDNATMVACLGYYYAQKMPSIDPLELEVYSSLSMNKTKWN